MDPATREALVLNAALKRAIVRAAYPHLYSDERASVSVQAHERNLRARLAAIASRCESARG